MRTRWKGRPYRGLHLAGEPRERAAARGGRLAVMCPPARGSWPALFLPLVMAVLLPHPALARPRIEVEEADAGVSIPADLLYGEPRAVLASFPSYRDKPYARQVLTTAAAADPQAALEYANLYKDQPYAQAIIEGAAKAEPWAALEYADRYLDAPYAAGIIAAAAAGHPAKALEFSARYQALPDGARILAAAAEACALGHPWAALKFADQYRGLPNAAEILGRAAEKAIKDDPSVALEYADRYAALGNAEDLLRRAVEAAVRQTPRVALQYADRYVTRAYATEAVSLAAERDPAAALRYAERYRDLPEASAVLARAAETALQETPWVVLEQAACFRALPGAEEIVRRAAEEVARAHPWAALRYADRYAGLPEAGAILARAAENASRNSPPAALEYARSYLTQPYAREIVETAARGDPWSALRFADRYAGLDGAEEILRGAAETSAWILPAAALQFANRYAGQPYAPAVIQRAAQKDPPSALEYADRYAGQPYAREIIASAALDCPTAALTYFAKLRPMLAQSASMPVMTLVRLGENSLYTLETRKKTSLLLEKMASGAMSLTEAVAIGADPDLLFRHLAQIRTMANPLGLFAVEQELASLSLRKVAVLNDLHSEPDQVRFKSVEKSSLEELYILMVYAEDEIYTSTFNGLFDRLMARLTRQRISGDRLLRAQAYNRSRSFIKLCAGYNRLNQFIGTMSRSAARNILEEFVRNIDQERDKVAQAATVADAFGSIREPEILTTLARTIEAESARVIAENDQEGMAIYGLLAGMFGERAAAHDAWLDEVARKYHLPNLAEVDATDLFDAGAVNVQLHCFYNDEDGEKSFQGFLAAYQKDRGWNVVDAGDYVVIASVGEGRRIEIYANKPTADEAGQDELDRFLQERNLVPSIVVHRGHSYHVPKTIQRIPYTARLVFLGSCGSYNNISAVLARAPEAHILSTKGTGTGTINDALLRMLNGADLILSGKNLNWQEFWTKAQAKLGKDTAFRSYVFPHKNFGVVFIKAYRQLVAETAPDEPIQAET